MEEEIIKCIGIKFLIKNQKNLKNFIQKIYFFYNL